MVVAHKNTRKLHSLRINEIKQTAYIPGGVHKHALARPVIANQVNEVGHLRREPVGEREVPSGQQLSQVKSHFKPPSL
jgi:hypothetical protein